MKTTLILGAGFGGISAAVELRRLVPECRVVLIDQSLGFTIGATKTWVMLGEATMSEVVHSRNRLKAKGIEFVQAEILSIDVEKRLVKTSGGEFTGDYLVVALGADLDMNAIPGLSSAETYYTLRGAEKLRSLLPLHSGSDIAFLTARTPYKCPPAPFEGAMVIHDYFRRRNATPRLNFYTPEAMPMATAGPEIGKYVVDELKKRSIGWNPLKKAVSIDAAAKRIVFEDGTTADYGLLIAVPVHVAPKVIRESALAGPGGWIPVEPLTLRVSKFSNVYAVGDCTTVPLPGRFKPDAPLVLPKAGVFADSHGKTVARHIAADALGKKESLAFDGNGFCYFEMGDMHAVKGEANFFALPYPAMKARVPDHTQFEEKKAWVSGWLREHFLADS